MSESVQLTAEVFIDTGKDFRPEDSLTVPYTCALGETVTLDFDLTGFEHTCGFRFDPLLEDGSMVKLEGLALTYEDDETRQIEMERIKTNSDVDFDPIFVYLHNDPKFFVDEALCLTALDFSGRPFLVFEAEMPQPMIGDYDSCLTEEFMRALAMNSGLTLHMKALYGKNAHHITEALFKSLGVAIKDAVQVTGTGVTSTKGVL